MPLSFRLEPSVRLSGVVLIDPITVEITHEFRRVPWRAALSMREFSQCPIRPDQLDSLVNDQVRHDLMSVGRQLMRFFAAYCC